ncbi:hypothetical protein HOF40_00400 [Candidatus Parcubacteria bacterium]|jgi:hypothetical protein|nr:hypothetical protein [Candidatus Parcubacteria bacterium]MBT3948530.1 hypothetical protein [Candidatus Parcubacteria bacterium]
MNRKSHIESQGTPIGREVGVNVDILENMAKSLALRIPCGETKAKDLLVSVREAIQTGETSKVKHALDTLEGTIQKELPFIRGAIGGDVASNVKKLLKQIEDPKRMKDLQQLYSD